MTANRIPSPASDATPTVSASGYDLAPLGAAERGALAATLNDEERRVLLNQGTERPFCGTLLDNKLHGTYACRLCGLPLFKSAAKFNSGTGWPSFYEAYDPAHVLNIEDDSHGMVRTEIRCKRCDGHLGHVFPDGPRPTGLRYCLNSASLEFYEQGQNLPQKTRADRSGPAKPA
jgi:peptide-methionine (R)-S-oxide reductase